jgi:crossover junction endodeoxyribonuclease RusA
MMITFTAYCTPTPQGSMKGFVVPGKNGAKPRAIVTADNKKLKPYRSEVTRCAMQALADSSSNVGQPFAPKHVPVSLVLDFTLLKPESCPRKRIYPVVKPDIDKLVRATLDALTGVLYADDAQVAEITTRKFYGAIENVHVSARVMDSELLQ